MTAMPSISEIRERSSLIPDEGIRRICVQIIDEVEKRTGRENQWTFQTFSKWTKLDPTDLMLFQSIQMLVASIETPLLEMHFLYFDPSSDDATGEHIADEEVKSAYRTGFLIHPHSGEKIHEFEEFLVPYFAPSARLVLQ